MIYDEYTIANLKLQIALNENNSSNMFSFPNPIESFDYNIFNSYRNCVCGGYPTYQSLDCCIVQSGYRPSAESYCCETSFSTNLEEQNYIMQQTAPYQQRVIQAERKCCGGRY